MLPPLRGEDSRQPKPLAAPPNPTDDLFGVRRPRRRFGTTPANRSRSRYRKIPRTTSLECGAHGAALEQRRRAEAHRGTEASHGRKHSLECGAHGAALEQRRRAEAHRGTEASHGRKHSLECGAHGAALEQRRRTEAHRGTETFRRRTLWSAAPTAPLWNNASQPKPLAAPKRSADDLFGVRRRRRRFGTTPANRSRSRYRKIPRTTSLECGAHGAALEQRRRTEAARGTEASHGRKHSLECGAHGAALGQRQRSEAHRDTETFRGRPLWSAAPTAPLWNNAGAPKPLAAPRRPTEENTLWSAAPEAPLWNNAGAPKPIAAPQNPADGLFGVRRPRRRFRTTP
jgi:hypothetical protein